MDCPICLQDLVRGALAVTPCGHPFHQHCLLQTLEHKKQCPICKAPAREAQCHALFLPSASAAESEPPGPDVYDLRDMLRRQEEELKELREYQRKAMPKLRDLKEKLATQTDHLKIMAHQFKELEEGRSLAEKVASRLQGEVDSQKVMIKELQMLVDVNALRRAGGDLLDEDPLATPQQKDDYIRNQKQMIAFLKEDLTEMRKEKETMKLDRDHLEEKVARLARRLSLMQERPQLRSPLHDVRTRPQGVTPEPAAKRLRPPPETLGSPVLVESSNRPGAPTTPLVGDSERSSAATLDHSVIEIADSSIDADDADDLLPSLLPVLSAVSPGVHGTRSFLPTAPSHGSTSQPPFAPQSLFRSSSALHSLASADRSYQTTLGDLLRRR